MAAVDDDDEPCANCGHPAAEHGKSGACLAFKRLTLCFYCSEPMGRDYPQQESPHRRNVCTHCAARCTARRVLSLTAADIDITTTYCRRAPDDTGSVIIFGWRRGLPRIPDHYTCTLIRSSLPFEDVDDLVRAWYSDHRPLESIIEGGDGKRST